MAVLIKSTETQLVNQNMVGYHICQTSINCFAERAFYNCWVDEYYLSEFDIDFSFLGKNWVNWKASVSYLIFLWMVFLWWGLLASRSDCFIDSMPFDDFM